LEKAKRRGPYNTYSNSKMFSAMDTAIASKNVSATAKTFCIPRSTLRGWTTNPELSECKKTGCTEKARPGPKPSLDSPEEGSFIADILQRNATNQATSIHTLLASAKQKWRVLGTRGWLKRVLERTSPTKPPSYGKPTTKVTVKWFRRKDIARNWLLSKRWPFCKGRNTPLSTSSQTMSTVQVCLSMKIKA
jgi:hypothetical protein